MASSWTKCNPDDPSTYPEKGEKVDFVAVGALGNEVNCRGEWTGRVWDDETDGGNVFTPAEVTHWQPLPALPGEELAGDEELAKVLDELESMFRATTPGKWKLWAMDVMADQAGDSDRAKAVPVAKTYYRDENGRMRTNDADWIATTQRNFETVLAAARRALAAKKGPCG
jgi:hypothetical protein